jgi:hypothetical protein
MSRRKINFNISSIFVLFVRTSIKCIVIHTNVLSADENRRMLHKFLFTQLENIKPSAFYQEFATKMLCEFLKPVQKSL